MTLRSRSLIAIAGLLLSLLLGAGMLRDGAEAQTRACTAFGYSSQRPLARFTATPNPVEAGKRAVFDASGSRGTNGVPITGYYWDLDGDGKFEALEATPSIAKRYTVAGPVSVRLQVVDQCRQVSPVATVLVEVRPDETPPSLRLSGKRTLSVRTAVRRGVKVAARCGEPCALTATATVDRRTRRALKLRRSRVARKRATLAAAGRRTLTLKPRLTAAQRRRALRRGSGTVTVSVVARDEAGNRNPERRRIKLRRR